MRDYRKISHYLQVFKKVTMTKTSYIKIQVPTSDKNISATLKLLSEECVILIISHYQKNQTVYI